jgi:glycosyltransferase involved in cell wall biosynthesis
MRILIVHNKYQSKNIGGEDIVYKNELSNLRSILGKKNVHSYEVSNDEINKIKLIFGIFFSFKHYREVKKIIYKNSIDLVHVHNFYPLLTPSIFKASKDAGAKVVHTLHNYRLWCISGIFYIDGFGLCEKCIKPKFPLSGIFNKCYRKSLLQSILAQASFWFYKIIRIFNNIDYFFVLTNFQKEKIISLGIDEKKIILTPNGLVINKHSDQVKDGYIFVGRFEESKGIFELLKVWSKLDEKFVLTVVGGGESEEALRRKYNKINIIFKGMCPRDETLKLISKSKYLIQPSIWYETFGLTIVEAMSNGVPVIGFDIGTRSDFIENGVNGFLSDRDNLKDVIMMSYQYFEYELLSNNAILKAKGFDNAYVIKEQIKIYNSILQDS